MKNLININSTQLNSFTKIKDKTFENGKLVDKEGKKVALIHETPLVQGFHRLNALYPKIGRKGIKMILGNHDLQTGKKLIVSKEYDYDVERDDFEKEKGCNIIQWQLRNAGYIHLDINHVTTYSSPGFRNSSSKHVETLILMLDTTIYSQQEEIDENGYMECYNIFLQAKHPKSDGPYTIAELRDRQCREIIIQLEHYTYDNLILIGHHPILTVKSKKESKIDASGKVIKEWTIQHTEDIPEFKEFFKLIAPQIKTDRIYYLCADLHLYQHGLVTITTGGKDFIINQYVAGTGGTELDDEYKHKDGANMDILDLQMPFVEDSSDYRVKYQMIDYKKECGFLVCHLKNGIRFDFISVKSKGGQKRTRVKNRLYNGRSRLSRLLT
jgi:hypothetical protein